MFLLHFGVDLHKISNELFSAFWCFPSMPYWHISSLSIDTDGVQAKCNFLKKSDLIENEPLF